MLLLFDTGAVVAAVLLRLRCSLMEVIHADRECHVICRCERATVTLRSWRLHSFLEGIRLISFFAALEKAGVD